MSTYLPSAHYYTLNDLEFNLKDQVIQYNIALLNTLNSNTLSAIKNAYHRAILVLPNGLCYINVSCLKHLLRTGNSGAENYLWQKGIPGYSSPSLPHTFGENIYISGPDFLGLLDARIQLTFGSAHLYLRYVKAIYNSITSSPILNDLRHSFVANIDSRRNQLKTLRINQYNITCCEFTGNQFSENSQVEFAHIESVATAPLQALNINNGVIILKTIHSNLTTLGIHDFAGMYDYCIRNNYSTIWAENYEL